MTDDAAEQMRFVQVRKTLMGKVQRQAVGKDSLGLGRGQIKFSPNATIYALAQCTRDLPARVCSTCISTVFDLFGQACPFSEYCQGFNSGCVVRSDTKPFFFGSES